MNSFETLEPRHLLAVVVNEIHYDPDLSTEQVEFIELVNTDSSAVDLSGWRIGSAVDYSFAIGSSISAGGYLVITQDAADFQAKYGFAPFGQWETGDKLSNDGETIELRDATNSIVDSVSYKLGFPWPTSGDYGSSIELINPTLDNDLGGNWRSSGISSSPNAGTSYIASGQTWRYRKGIVANPPSVPNVPAQNWQLTGFVVANDSVPWQTGTPSIGYGDGDDVTVLSDMADNYSSIYLRKDFTISGAVPNRLTLRIYVDDGAIVSINGREVQRFHVTSGDKNYDGLSGEEHEAAWEEVVLTGADEYLVAGINTVAVHVLNSTLNSTDLSFNLELNVPPDAIGAPTPGAQNSVFAANAAPQLRQLKQSVQQPVSGQDVVVSIKATDPQGVASVNLEYQLVDPGAYIRLTDAAYITSWTTVTMHDDGLSGDVVAGDSIYSATLPGSLQVNRRLVRYRISATDGMGASIRGPYADDPQPNFAYFVYDGVPDYTASVRPGVAPNATYSGDKLDDIATYQLIADATDVQNSQYNGAYNETEFHGTLVYDGVVYDHISFRNRGVASTYAVGKNKWKLEFTRGHYFQARDDYGVPYQEKWDEINVLPGTNPWWRNDASTDGTVLFEPVAFKLYELAGTPAPNTTYFNFRVIDGASEAGGNQYSGDFWGLYIGIEQPDGSFLDERDLPDGSIFNMHGSVFGSTTQRHQGSELPTDRSDLSAFLAGVDSTSSLQWWEDNLNWDSYFAWNLVNFAVNNSDIRPNENVNYYHNQEDGKWYVLPWDLDLTFEDAPHFSAPITSRENIRTLIDTYPAAKLAYQNRLREITDLLLANGDAAQVVDELAGVLTLHSGDTTIVGANQAQWDYNPLKVKKGIWYQNFNPALLTNKSFAGVVSYMEAFLSPGGYGYNQMVAQGSDVNIPSTPTISYVGLPDYPADSLVFQTSTFSDPQGAGTFAKMEWRVAKVDNATTAGHVVGAPYTYELEGTWESGELNSFASQLAIPAGVVQAGDAYRARVRMQDADGHWSHWSNAVEFVPGPNAAAPSLAITELHYNPASDSLVTDAQDLEYVELLNTGTQTLSLEGVRLTTFASNPYVFGAGLTLAPGQRIVVPKNPAVFQSYYGGGVNIAPGGYGSGNLSNGGETIDLVAADGALIESITYDDAAPWTTAPDGNGPSLEIVDPWGDPHDAANWRASAMFGGSPGWDGAAGQPGDYDRNALVAGGDFLAWQRSFGSRTPALLGADGSGNLTVDLADLAIWQIHYGESSSPFAAAALDTAREAATENAVPDVTEWILTEATFNSAATLVATPDSVTLPNAAPTIPLQKGAYCAAVDAAHADLPAAAAWRSPSRTVGRDDAKADKSRERAFGPRSTLAPRLVQRECWAQLL